jgi:hypothetical protein
MRAAKIPLNAQNATPGGVAFHGPALVTSLPNRCARWLFLPYLLQTFPAGLPLLKAAALAIARAGCLLFFGLAELLSSSRYITGT